MKNCNLAILGGTGAVGMEMLKILQERNFPLNNLAILSGQRSAGKTFNTPFGKLTAIDAALADFGNFDIVLGASENNIAKTFAPKIKEAGAIFIDNSSAFRMNDNVPLVIPEINPEDAIKHKGIISNPNCSTIIALIGVYEINKLSKIESMVVSTYQAVSGVGINGPITLFDETSSILNNKAINDSKIFKHQIAFNLIPAIGSADENGYTSEEMKMQNEGRKIMHLPNLNVSCTCVRVPVERSHSISINLKTENILDLDVVKNVIKNGKGCKLIDDVNNDRYPMPKDTSDQDLVYVGRIRKDLTAENGINLWCVGDQIRKGAATNTVQIAELVI